MKNKLMGRVVVVCLGFFLVGCASLHESIFGRDIKLSPLANATLGSTPRTDIMRQFGAPSEIDRRWFESFEAEVFLYQEQYNGNAQRIQQRILVCEFSKGVLTAYSFRDSGEEESPQQSYDSLHLVKGKSTREDVQSVLGIAKAKALLPTTITLPVLDMKLGAAPLPLARLPEGVKETWQYYSQDFNDAMNKSNWKTLTLFFDGKGIYLGSFLMREQVIK